MRLANTTPCYALMPAPITVCTHLCQVVREHGTLSRSCKHVPGAFIYSKKLGISVHCQTRSKLSSVCCLCSWVYMQLVLYTIVYPLMIINYDSRKASKYRPSTHSAGELLPPEKVYKQCRCRVVVYLLVV